MPVTVRDGSPVRDELLALVQLIGPQLATDIPLGVQQRHLPPGTVSALYDAGLTQLKVPAELGGFEAEPVLQYEIFEAVAHHNMAAGWCLFIYADTAGMVGARLPDAGLDQMLVNGKLPICCGGGGLKPGRLTPTAGGLELSGHWRYGSGIHGASWVLVSALLAGEDGARPTLLSCMVPKASLTVHDTWQVHGLEATGSHDFSAESVFVPRELTFSPQSPPLRGGRQYRTGIVGYLGYTVPAACGAVARRALDELTERAGSSARGYAKPSALAQRGAFQAFLGRADMQLRASRALMLADAGALMEDVDRPGIDLRARDAQTRAASSYATGVALEVLQGVVRFAGGDGLRDGAYLEQAVRDVTMAANHLLMNDVAFENHAQFRLGLPGADPMA